MTVHTLDDLRSGRLAGVRELTLRDGLESVPPELFELADTLEILDLSGNRLVDLPDAFARLGRLRVLFLSGNPIRRAPAVLGRMPELEMVGLKSCGLEELPPASLPRRLRWLILTDNRLAALPDELGRRPRLQKLMLAGNRLETLPDLSACGRLELARLSANQLASLPDALLDLPALAWLAFSGNPFCAPRRTEAASHAWDRIALGERLGGGASGDIHRAVLRRTDSVHEDVAVKLFRGSVTSDGFPDDEREAALAAGGHDRLIPVLGRLTGHPEGRDGLVMRLVPPGRRPLGSPPSYATCTRDTWPDGTTFAPAFAERVVDGIGDLVDHLHERGVCHGDLYAHNILVDDQGDPLLGDFGAAGFLDDLPPRQREAMVRIERRAVGVLSTELRARSAAEAGAT